MTYRFDGFEVDLEQFMLRDSKGPIPLEPQVFDLLIALLENRDHVVTKNDLLELVWPDRIVAESNLTVRINALRAALGDSGAEQRFIKTVRGRGYQFVAEVLENRASAPRAPSALPAFVSLFGRDAELVQLREAMAAVDAGASRVVFVAGNAGLGKTTLIESAIAQLPEGFVVGTGQCVDHRTAEEPYMAVLEALGQVVETMGKDAVELLRSRAPTWLAQLPWLMTAQMHAEVQQRTLAANPQRMLRESIAALVPLSEMSPIALRFEDIHWSDHGTVDFLEQFARSSAGARILIVASYRKADVIESGHPLATMIPSLVHRGLASELALEPLDADSVGAYIDAELSMAAQGELKELLHTRTEGHPLFMASVMRDWIDRGLVANGEVSDALRDAADELPAGIRILVQQRFEAQDDDVKAMLMAGATAGLRFCAEEVAAITEREVEEIEDTLDAQARIAGLIVADELVRWPDGTMSAGYRFVHGVHREVISDQLSASRAARFHRTLAQRLEVAWASNTRAIAGRLADHFTRGREMGRAVGYRLTAAENALGRNAYREAISHCEAGLASVDELPATPETKVLEIDLALTLAAPLIGRDGWSSPKVEPLYRRAIEHAEETQDMVRLVRALFGISYYHEYRGELPTAQVYIGRIMKFADNLHPTMQVGTGLIMACSCFHQGRFDESVEYADRAAAIYDPKEHVKLAGTYGSDPSVGALRWSGLSLAMLGSHAAAQRRLADAMELARKPTHSHSLSSAFEGQAMLSQLLGNREETERYACETIDDANRYGFDYRELTGSIMLGWARAMARHDDGSDKMEAALAEYRKTGAVLDLPYFLTLLADGCRVLGRPERALEALEEVETLRAARRGGNTDRESNLIKAAVLRDAGRTEDADLAETQARLAAERRHQQSLRGSVAPH